MTGATTSCANSRTLWRSASRSSPRVKSTMANDQSLDGCHAVTAAGEGAVLVAGGGEPPDQLVAQPGRLDDGVHDQLAGQAHDVDVLLVLGALLRDEGGALLVAVQ